MYTFKESKAEALSDVRATLLSHGLNPNDYELDNIIWPNRFGNRWFVPVGYELESRAEAYKKHTA